MECKRHPGNACLGLRKRNPGYADASPTSFVARMSDAISGARTACADPHIAALMRATETQAPPVGGYRRGGGHPPAAPAAVVAGAGLVECGGPAAPGGDGG